MSEPIRVLHIVTQMNRNGLESRTMDLYRSIDRDKVQFDFFTHRENPGEFDDEIQQLGGCVYYNSKLSPFRFVKYTKELNVFFKKHKYDIVHSHLNTASSWVLMAAKRAGVDVRIAHSRNSGMEKNWKSVFKFLSKLFINIPTTHKFACSYQAGEWLFGKNNIKKDENFKVIPNAIDTTKFTYLDEKRLEIRAKLDLKNELAIVHVGRLTYQKNHVFLLKVFKEIIDLKPDAKLFLIGEGELREEINENIKELGLVGLVHLLGSQEDVGKYLQGMDLFVFPSHFEGFGTVVIEAQCVGLPVVASDVLPLEVKVTPLLKFMSLNDEPKKWASEAILLSNNKRTGFESSVIEAGYDINKSYADMQEFYIDCYNKYKSK